MTSGKCFFWTILSIVGLLMSGCKDKPDRARPGQANPISTSRPAKSGSDRPIIGLTSVYRTGRGRNNAYVRVGMAYVRCITESGGAPVILPVIQDSAALEQYVRRLDGLVVIGGADIPLAACGQKPIPQTKTMPAERYDFESKLISRWLKTDKPLLGVCLGAQFVNVVAGGTLIQDIPTQVGTKVIHRGRGAGHEITIDTESRLRKILAAERVKVNSSHHQAIGDIGKGLKVVARSDDGVIEAVEMSGGRFCLLVQWHPERMSLEHRKALFGALINACKKGN